MKCERAREWFSDLIDGSIGPSARLLLEAHLASCTQCAAEIEALRKVWSDLDSLPALQPPIQLRATIWQRIDAAGTQATPHPVASRWSRLPLWVRVTSVVAAGVAFLALATVSVPGRFHTAGWTSWFTRAVHRSTSKQTTVTVAHASYLHPEAASGPSRVAILLRVKGDPCEAQIVLLGPGGEVGRRSVRVSEPSTTVEFPITAGMPVPQSVRIEWRPSGSEPRSITATVR